MAEYTARLPKVFMPTKSPELIRMGRDHDGGYLVVKDDIMNADGLLSFGVNDDWSFEEDFYAANASPILAYDGSVGEKYFIKDFISWMGRVDKPYIAVRKLNTYRSYKKFFQGNRAHIQKFISDFSFQNWIPIEEVFSALQQQNVRKPFLKMDIEGGEYRILNALIEHSANFTGATMEIHDLDLHLDTVAEFIDAFAHPLVHIHCNNSGPINGQGTPLVIELTFSSAASVLDDMLPQLPHRLDMPNVKRLPDYQLEFV